MPKTESSWDKLLCEVLRPSLKAQAEYEARVLIWMIERMLRAQD